MRGLIPDCPGPPARAVRRPHRRRCAATHPAVAPCGRAAEA